MIIPVLKFCHRSTLVAIEILAAIFFVLLGLMCVVFWKLSQGPVDVTFAADAVKRAIVSSDHTTDFKFDGIVAEWPEFNGPIIIGLSGVKLLENGKPVLNVPQLGIRIAKTPLLVGYIKPEAIIAKDATLKLVRSKSGGVHLLLSDAEKIAEAGGETTPVAPVSAASAPAAPASASTDEKENTGFKDLGEALFLGGNLPDYHEIQPLSRMERFSVENAHVIIVDEETGKGWNIPRLDMDLFREENDFKIQASYKEGNNQATHFSFLLSRSEADGAISFKSDIDEINVSTLGRLFLPVEPSHGPQFIVRGNVAGTLDKDWEVEKLDAELASDKGDFNLNGLLGNTPLKFSNLAAFVSYDKASQKIVLHDTHVAVNGQTIQLGGEKQGGASNPIFGLRVFIPETSFDQIQSLWPEDQRTSLAADWLTKRLSKAKIKNLDVTLPIDILHPDELDPTKIDGKFDYENLTADYRAPLLPVTEGKGKATLKDDTLDIEVQSGKLGELEIKKGRVMITHLTHPTTVGDVIIDADGVGPISTVLDYIYREPILLGDKIGLDPKKVKGITDLNVHVTFPALADLPAEDVKVVAKAKLKDVLLPSITHGLDLTGGPYDLEVKAGSVVISGNGSLGGTPLALANYTAYLDLAEAPYISELKATVTTNQKMREIFGVHLDQFVEGNVPVTISYQEQKNGDEAISIDADAASSVLKFAPFRYRKPVGVAANATCDVLIQKGEVRSVKNLKIAIGKDGKAEGTILFDKVGSVNDVKSGQFPVFKIAGDNDFALDFTQTAPNVFDVKIKGRQIDGRAYLGGGDNPVPKEINAKADAAATPTKVDNSDSPIVTVSTNVAQIKTGNSSDQILLKPTLSIKTDKNGDVTFLDLKGQFDGGKITVSLQPNEKGRSVLAVSSNNAGKALHVLDLYDQMIGGTLDIRGTQMADGAVNDIAGKAQISNFTIVKAPILAKLINLFSLSGLTELLQNKGIGFEKMKSDFEWKDTDAGRMIALKNGKTSGASISLTFAGTVNQDKGVLDIGGTFVPVAEINGILNKIPLIGGLLTGGKNGGIIAATYDMKGSPDDPSVMINPLSVLTPGFLRSLLFEGDTAIFDDGGAKKETPKKERAPNN